jgi:hypothetical protein
MAIEVLRLPGTRVLWVDGEQGERAMASRAILLGLATGLGLTREQIDSRVVFLPLASLDQAGLKTFMQFVLEYRFDLVVWDPFEAHLANAGFNGNDNDHVGRWFTWMHNPVGLYGGVTVCIDHVGVDLKRRGRPKGAGMKGDRPRILYLVERKKKFDRDSIGEIEIRCTKNSEDAEIIDHRRIVLGGNPFIFDESAISNKEAKEAAQMDRRSIVTKAMAILVAQRRLKPGPNAGWVSKNELAKVAGGRRRSYVLQTLNELVTDLTLDGESYGPFVEVDIRPHGEEERTYFRASEVAVNSGRW